VVLDVRSAAGRIAGGSMRIVVGILGVAVVERAP